MNILTKTRLTKKDKERLGILAPELKKFWEEKKTDNSYDISLIDSEIKKLEKLKLKLICKKK